MLTDCSVYERATVRDKYSGEYSGGLVTAMKQQREAAADVRRDQMLIAASHLIAERGFSDTRIADVAERVGASSALVIYYFKTKDSLLTEALRWSERSFYSAVEEMLQETPALEDRIENLVAACLPVADETPDDWGLWFDLWAQAFRHPEVKKDRVALDKQWRELIARVVRAGIANGEIDELDVEAFTVMWSALLDGLVVQVALDDPLVDVPYAQRVARDVALKELGLS